MTTKHPQCRLTDEDGDVLHVYHLDEGIYVTAQLAGGAGTTTAGPFTRAQLDAALDEVAPAASQEPQPLPDEGELGIHGDWLVVLNAQEADYPAGAEWGHIPGSQHAPLLDLSRVAGYPPEPTDDEVEAAAEAAFLSTGPSIANGMTSAWANGDEHQRERWRTRARAALSAARRARGGAA